MEQDQQHVEESCEIVEKGECEADDSFNEDEETIQEKILADGQLGVTKSSKISTKLEAGTHQIIKMDNENSVTQTNAINVERDDIYCGGSSTSTNDFYIWNSSLDDKGEDQMDLNKDFIKDESLENHPHKQGLLSFEPTSEQLSPVTCMEAPKSLEETPLCEINTKAQLEKLVDDLRNEKELGIDVEYSDHGYVAVTCLVQISTKDKDYIIDALSLENDILLLSDIFSNVNIVKIFHAGCNDLRWLQQDCHLFVINMFDTQRAMQTLQYKKVGLDAALLNYNIKKNKTLQRADFRIRPLPPLYKDYARTDSHFLIHMYHILKNELIAKNLLRKVLDNCHHDCKIMYGVVNDGSYLSVRDNIIQIHDRQLLALEKLNNWRHKVAQYVDKNPGYILSKANMKTLVLQFPLGPGEILRIAKSEYVKEHLQEILSIVGQPHYKEPHKSPRRARSLNFAMKRKLEQTDANNFTQGGYGKRSSDSYYNANNQSKRNKYNQPSEFDPGNTLNAQETFKRNSCNQRWFRK